MSSFVSVVVVVVVDDDDDDDDFPLGQNMSIVNYLSKNVPNRNMKCGVLNVQAVRSDGGLSSQEYRCEKLKLTVNTLPNGLACVSGAGPLVPGSIARPFAAIE